MAVPSLAEPAPEADTPRGVPDEGT